MPELYLDDHELLKEIAADNHVAFAQFYQKYWKLCYGKVMEKSGDEILAEEITQLIFISLWEKRHHVQIKNVPSYLFSAIKFQFINHIKSQLYFERYASYKQFDTARENQVENQLNYRYLKDAIDHGVGMLPIKSKTVFTLSRFKSFSVKEIAKELNLSEKSVEYHITKSLKTMRVVLKEYLLTGILLMGTFFYFFL